MMSQCKYITRTLLSTALLMLMTVMFSARTLAQPALGPTLASPQNGAVNQPLTPAMQWYSLANASSYELQIAADSGFSSIVIDSSNITDTIVNVGTLNRSTKYYWRVRAIYLLFMTAWSNVWSFSTIPQLPSAPVLLQPQNNAVNQPTAVIFSWNTSSNGVTYRLQASTDSTFASTFLDHSAISSTSYSAGGFASGTTYFWRMSSSNPGGTSAWSSVWRFSTVLPVPSAPVLLSPVNGATGQSTSLVLSWNAAAGAGHYWLQIAADTSFSTIIIGDTAIAATSKQINYLASGTEYYWRLKALNSSGESGWSSVWNFTTASAQTPPAVPSLLSPADSSSGQPTTLTLSWNAVANADHYWIQVASDSRFATMVYTNYTLIGTSVQISGLAGTTTYYWQVRAVNAAGQSNWSSAWSFTTSSVPLPAIPVLLSPANGAGNQPLTLKLVWNASRNATSYHLQLSGVSDFASKLVDDSLVTDTTRTIVSLTNGKDYYWRVSAANSNGVSAWSSLSKFTTLPQPPLPPIPASPANDSVIDTTIALLAWNSSSGATSYWLQDATDSLFHTVTYSDSTITTLSQQISGLLRGTNYFWRVSAKNAGGTSAWSTIRKFAIAQSPPAPPTPSSPPNGAVIDSTTVTLAWQASQGAASYWLQVSSDSTFQAFAYNDSALKTTSQQVSGLQPNTKYFWRVNASSSTQRSPWTQPNSFATTSSGSAAGSEPVSPPDGATGESINPTLSWSSTSGASAYELQVATDRNFSVVVYDNSSISGTSQTIGPLANNTAYYWHVRSFSLLFTSTWSSTWKFTTVSTTPTVPPVPALLSPANGATNQSTNLTLSWGVSSSATAYQLQVSVDSIFSSTVYNDSTISATSQPVGPLAIKSTYYWHARAKNSVGWSLYSSPWKFSTSDTVSSMPTAVTKPATGVSATSATLNASVNANGSSTTVNFQYGTTTSYGTSIAGIPSVATGDTATAIAKTLTGLSPSTLYHYRISATNQSGAAYGADQVFTTSSDTVSSLPTAITEPASNITGTSATLNAVVTPNGYPTTVRFQFDTSTAYGNSVDGVPLVVSGDSSSAVSNTLNGLTPYTTYHYRVSATNQAGSIEGGDRTFTTSLPPYPSSFSLDTTIFFPIYKNPSDYKATDYQIVGLPGNSRARIDSFLVGTQKKDWAVYWDNGSGANNLVAFDGGQNFTASSGKAFWLIRKGPWSVKGTVPSAPLDSSEAVNVPLHSGWNLITNPFISSVAWSSLQSVNGISEPIYSFNKSFNAALTFQPYIGYYYFNTGNKPFLKIPYATLYTHPLPAQSPVAFGKSVRSSNQSGWRIQIAFSSADSITDQSTWLGVSENISGENNDSDFHKPAGVRDIPSVYFNRPEWDPEYSTFATDIRPMFVYQNTWTFEVWSPARSESKLIFNNINSIPEQFEVYLFDREASRAVNLRENPSYAFTPAQQTSEFVFAVGVKDSVQHLLQSVRTPQTFTLGNNYPNPFNPSTSIPLEVPARSTIELKVFNVLGQEIKTLYAGSLDAGKYWFTWNGMDSENRQVPSGCYFSRLTTSTGYHTIRKMMLLK